MRSAASSLGEIRVLLSTKLAISIRFYDCRRFCSCKSTRLQQNSGTYVCIEHPRGTLSLAQACASALSPYDDLIAWFLSGVPLAHPSRGRTLVYELGPGRIEHPHGMRPVQRVNRALGSRCDEDWGSPGARWHRTNLRILFPSPLRPFFPTRSRIPRCMTRVDGNLSPLSHKMMS